jgi:3-hydroxyisobutyrate dehydrogenase
MGSEMATNLFSKQLAASKDAQFIVCDAVPEAAQYFRDVFTKKYPEAKLTIAESPQEQVLKRLMINEIPHSL